MLAFEAQALLVESLDRSKPLLIAVVNTTDQSTDRLDIELSDSLSFMRATPQPVAGGDTQLGLTLKSNAKFPTQNVAGHLVVRDPKTDLETTLPIYVIPAGSPRIAPKTLQFRRAESHWQADAVIMMPTPTEDPVGQVAPWSAAKIDSVDHAGLFTHQLRSVGRRGIRWSIGAEDAAIKKLLLKTLTPSQQEAFLHNPTGPLSTEVELGEMEWRLLTDKSFFFKTPARIDMDSKSLSEILGQ